MDNPNIKQRVIKTTVVTLNKSDDNDEKTIFIKKGKIIPINKEAPATDLKIIGSTER